MHESPICSKYSVYLISTDAIWHVNVFNDNVEREKYKKSFVMLNGSKKTGLVKGVSDTFKNSKWTILQM